MLIVVAALLWSGSAFAVVRCEFDGKIEYRDAPCPQGTGRTPDSNRNGTPGTKAVPAPPIIRAATSEAQKTNAEREEENAQFLQQERRLREERLSREAQQAKLDADKAAVSAAATAPADVAQPEPPPPSAPRQAGKVKPGGGDRVPDAASAKATSSKFGGFYLYLLPLAAVIAMAIVQTRRGSGSAWRWGLAAIFGLLSGFLLYFIAFMLFMPKGGPGPTFVLITLSGGWVLSTWFMGNGAESLLRVLRRGFLLGAVEWLIVIPASWVWTGRAVVSTVESIGPGAYGMAGAILGGGLIALFTGGVAFVMLVLCIVGYLIVYYVQRDKSPARSAPLAGNTAT